ncbi:MAG: hypothetical protein D6798_00165 [Deltaproteobacteria bacterium]|nr:MAG: hypothetical protein D6798_00165 [Deltaproteobacteria bacterium]
MADNDTLLRKIEATLGRARESDDLDDDGAGRGRSVPYDRFFRANERRKDAEKGLAALRAEVEKLREAHAAELEKIKASAAEEVARISAQYQVDLELTEAGLDRFGRKALRMAWEELPEAARGDSPLAWWKQVTEKAKAGEEIEVPKPLTPYLPAAEQPADDKQVGGQQRQAADGFGVTLGTGLNVDRGAAPPQPGQQRTADKVAKAKSMEELLSALDEA